MFMIRKDDSGTADIISADITVRTYVYSYQQQQLQGLSPDLSLSFCFSEVMSQQQKHEEGEGKEPEDVQTGFSTKDFNLVKLHILSQSHIREIR